MFDFRKPPQYEYAAKSGLEERPGKTLLSGFDRNDLEEKHRAAHKEGINKNNNEDESTSDFVRREEQNPSEEEETQVLSA